MGLYVRTLQPVVTVTRLTTLSVSTRLQYIGDSAFDGKFKLLMCLHWKQKSCHYWWRPAGMSAAFHLRKMGIASTIFEERPELGGMMRYGIPGYVCHANVWNMRIPYS